MREEENVSALLSVSQCLAVLYEGCDDVTVCLQRTYDIKWRVWNEQQDVLECCFLAKVKLVR